MIRLKSLFPVCLLMLLLSCQKEEIFVPQEHELLGSWRSQTVTVENQDGVDFDDPLGPFTILGLDENGGFIRNYALGSWNLNGSLLTLIPENGGLNNPRAYRIIELTESTLVLELSTTEEAYSRDFEPYSSNETLTITEVFERE